MENDKKNMDKIYFYKILENIKNRLRIFQVPKHTSVLENIRELFIKTIF